MGIFEVTDKASIAPLFEHWQETMIWSCLQGCMGSAYATAATQPPSAQICIADFHFFAGIPDADLVRNRPTDGALLIPQNEDWAALMETVYGPRATRRLRYAFHKDADGFDPQRLAEFAAHLPQGYACVPIDGPLYRQILSLDWARDLCAQFADEDDYARRGLGVAVLRAGEVVAGASSYTVYRTGIEVEIDTRPDQRRLGLARACGAGLILACLDRGLYPSWDAHNPASAALAEQLGYRAAGAYCAYELSL